MRKPRALGPGDARARQQPARQRSRAARRVRASRGSFEELQNPTPRLLCMPGSSILQGGRRARPRHGSPACTCIRCELRTAPADAGACPHTRSTSSGTDISSSRALAPHLTLFKSQVRTRGRPWLVSAAALGSRVLPATCTVPFMFRRPVVDRPQAAASGLSAACADLAVQALTASLYCAGACGMRPRVPGPFMRAFMLHEARDHAKFKVRGHAWRPVCASTSSAGFAVCAAAFAPLPSEGSRNLRDGRSGLIDHERHGQI